MGREPSFHVRNNMAYNTFEHVTTVIKGIQEANDFENLAFWIDRVFGLGVNLGQLQRIKAQVADGRQAVEVLRTETDPFVIMTALDRARASLTQWDVKKAWGDEYAEAARVVAAKQDQVTPDVLKAALDEKGKAIFPRVEAKMNAVAKARQAVEEDVAARMKALKEIEDGAKSTFSIARENVLYLEVTTRLSEVEAALEKEPGVYNLQVEKVELLKKKSAILQYLREQKDTWATDKVAAMDESSRAKAQALSDAKEELHKEVLAHLLESSPVTPEQAEAWAGANVFMDSTTKAKLKRLKYPIDDFYRDAAEFYRLVGGNVGAVEFTTNRGRAYAKGRANVSIGSEFDKRVLFHELGHIVDAWESGFPQAAKAFIAARADGGLRLLSAITGNRRYRRDEVAYPDSFIHPYVGKLYKHNSSEVMSMGLECLSSPDACDEIMSKDMEHFRLVMGAALHRNPLKQAAIEQHVEKSAEVREKLTLEEAWNKELSRVTKGLDKRLTVSSQEYEKNGFGGMFISMHGTRKGILYALDPKWNGGPERRMAWLSGGTTKFCTSLAYLLIAYDNGLLPDMSEKDIDTHHMFYRWAERWLLNGKVPFWFTPEMTLPKLPME